MTFDQQDGPKQSVSVTQICEGKYVAALHVLIASTIIWRK